jgi:hypothetical protein
MALAFIVGTSTKAEATLTLYLCNDFACLGGGDVIVADGSVAPADSNPAAGAVTFMGAFDAFSSINVNSAFSKPSLGTAATPQIDLLFSAISTGAADAWIYASETDYTGIGFATFTFGGTTAGQATVFAWGGFQNTQLTMMNPIGTTPLGPFTGAFSGTTGEGITNVAPFVNPYALTIGVHVVHAGAGSSTGDLNLTVVPEPASMALFGLGLMGFGVASRRRRQKK